MAYKAWYERAAEIENAQEREEFIQGALSGGIGRGSGARAAQAALTGLLIGWGLRAAVKKLK